MSQITQQTVGNCTAEVAAEQLRKHDNFLIVSHVRPDGDCLGSTIGLLLGLKKMGKNAAAFNAGPLGEKWEWLDGIDLVSDSLPPFEPEMTVFVDCGSVNRVTDDFTPFGKILNIDHHLTNAQFGDYNYIDIDACAVGEQISILLQILGVERDSRIATALYTSVMSDTGGFRYSNTSERTFILASELVALGADPATVAQNVFENRSRGEALLVGRAFSTLQYEIDGLLAWSELRQKDLRECGEETEPDGLSSELRGIRGVEVSCLMHEGPEGDLRVSFRGKGAVDCSKIAQSLGGGGHFNASGARIQGIPYEEAREKVLGKLREVVSEYQKRTA